MKKDKLSVNIAVRVTEAQKAKLEETAIELGVSLNMLIGMLIDNMELEKVERIEPVARLKKGGKSDAA
jgi:hypothetical protein